MRRFLICCLLSWSGVNGAQNLGPHDINGQGCLTCHTTMEVDPTNIAATVICAFGILPMPTAVTDSSTCTVVFQLRDGRIA